MTLNLISKTDNSPTVLWCIPAAAPIVTLILVFYFGQWSWGLMDDLAVLSSGNTAWERFISYFKATLQFGQFKPFYALFTGVSYSIFEDAPANLYIIKALFAAFVLITWGTAAYRLTRRRVCFMLLPAITLSFHYFYDVFFYLSSHEIVGLFFLGCALNLFIFSLTKSIQKGGIGGIHWAGYLAGMILLYCAFLSKEPFVSCGAAIGMSFVCGALIFRKLRKPLFIMGALILFFSVGHALFLNLYIKKAYTSAYSLTDLSRITSNLYMWAKKDLLNHIPWIIAGLTVFLKTSAESSEAQQANTRNLKLWGVITGVALYLLYLGILLPWSTTVYYAAPFGIFFAFILTVSIADRIARMPPGYLSALVLMSLLMNLFVCQYALARESTYQYDTQNLMMWFNEQDFLVSSEYHRDHVLCNAMEASDAIPGLINRKWDRKMPYFQYTHNPEFLLHGHKQEYFLYSPRFSAVNLTIFQNGWRKEFISKNWTVFKRVNGEKDA